MTTGYHSPSATSQDWCTPPKYAEAVQAFFGGRVGLDPCSNAHSTVNARVEWSLPETDGLAAQWDHSTIFVNPPYGRDPIRRTTIYDWLSKCADARKRFGAEVLALVPVATNTRHWKRFVFGEAMAVAFLGDTRLRFHMGGNPVIKGSPRACAMIYWGERAGYFEDVFADFGAVVFLSRRGKWNAGVPAAEGPGKAEHVPDVQLQ